MPPERPFGPDGRGQPLGPVSFRETPETAVVSPFLKESPTRLIHRLNAGRHGVAIIGVNQDTHEHKLDGYVLPVGPDYLVVMRNGFLMKGEMPKFRGKELQKKAFLNDFRNQERDIYLDMSALSYMQNGMIRDESVVSIVNVMTEHGMLPVLRSDTVSSDPDKTSQLQAFVQRGLVAVDEAEARLDAGIASWKDRPIVTEFFVPMSEELRTWQQEGIGKAIVSEGKDVPYIGAFYSLQLPHEKETEDPLVLITIPHKAGEMYAIGTVVQVEPNTPQANGANEQLRQQFDNYVVTPGDPGIVPFFMWGETDLAQPARAIQEQWRRTGMTLLEIISDPEQIGKVKQAAVTHSRKLKHEKERLERAAHDVLPESPLLTGFQDNIEAWEKKLHHPVVICAGNYYG